QTLPFSRFQGANYQSPGVALVRTGVVARWLGPVTAWGTGLGRPGLRRVGCAVSLGLAVGGLVGRRRRGWRWLRQIEPKRVEPGEELGIVVGCQRTASLGLRFRPGQQPAGAELAARSATGEPHDRPHERPEDDEQCPQ